MKAEEIEVGRTYEGTWLGGNCFGVQRRKVVGITVTAYRVEVLLEWHGQAGVDIKCMNIRTFAAGALRDVTEE